MRQHLAATTGVRNARAVCDAKTRFEFSGRDLRAIRNRLGRIEQGRQKVEDLEKEYQELETLGEFDRLAGLDEKLVEANLRLKLMQDEEPRLRELIAAAEAITRETKIDKILEIVDGPFADRAVLFFTEYKATQSLLMSARSLASATLASLSSMETSELKM